MANERRPFLLEGSRSTTTASIKTAIIRPTNYYEQGHRGSSFGSKLDQQAPHCTAKSTLSPVACNFNGGEMVLDRGIIEDPLSDSSALLYGTNATCRRRSKVEAWMENSSSAHSEDSPTNSDDHSYPSPAMKLPPLSPCNLSQGHLDLSFENLCQELLALSASCTTLERLINQSGADIDVINQSGADIDAINQSGAEIDGMKKSGGEIDVTNQSGVNIEDGRHQLSDLDKRVRTQRQPDIIPNHVNIVQPDTIHSEPPMVPQRLRTPPQIPPRSHSSFLAVQKMAHQHYNHKTAVLGTTSPQGQFKSSGSQANQISSLVIPSDKLQALTVDVGHNKHSKLTKVPVPVKNGLITITSPQSCLFSEVLHEKRATSRVSTQSAKTSKARRVPATHSHKLGNGTQTDVPGQAEYTTEIKSSEHQNCGNPLVITVNSPTDHVSAAIITQPRQGPQVPTPQASRKIHRSISEPSTFINFTPDKRVNLAKSQSKRDSRNRAPPQLKIGMDFIRRSSIKDGTSDNRNFDIKDNLLFNNLNHQQSYKKTVSSTNKLSLGGSSSKQVSRFQSVGSDSVFEVAEPIRSLVSQPPNFTSTYKSSEKSFTISSHQSSQDSNCDKSGVATGTATTTTSNSTSGKSAQKCNSLSKQTNESFSSSFESEALDFLASLKSTNALKSQYNKHNKFPTDVDPITGTPRHSTNSGDCGWSGKPSSRSVSNGSKSSCSPTSPPHNGAFHHQTSRSPQTPTAHRYRQSYYDNVTHGSPFSGVRVSLDSASSSGTVFSRPWGDISRWEDYFRHNPVDFRHRVDSAVSSQGKITDTELRNHLTPNILPAVTNHIPVDSHRSGEQTTPKSSTPGSNIKLPVSSLPDVAQLASTSSSSSLLSQTLTRTNWETALDRTISKVRLYTRLLQSDESSCEISRYAQGLVTNSQSLPGTLIARFITCTWDTNPAAELSLQLQLNTNNNTSKLSASDHHNNNSVPESGAKTDWYSSKIQPQWTSNPVSTKRSLNCGTAQAYTNDGYLLNTASRDRAGSAGLADSSLSPTTEHKILSNVRQFIDGMKRFLLNEPDAQLLYAIQRERVKMGSEQFINLDAVLEAVLEKVILQPLSDHLLNTITSHPDYTLRRISRMESGMKVVVLNKSELFSHLGPLISAVEAYKQTIRSAFQSIKSEFSPLSKLQYVLQTALLFVLLYNKYTSHKPQDLQFLVVYALACYGDATLLVHLAYTRHLIPASLRSGATAYAFSLYETCAQVYDRLSKMPATLNHRKMMLYEILDKLSCEVVITDESTNQIVRRSFPLTRWCSVAELVDMVVVDLANNDVKDHQLYLFTEEKELLLRPGDVVSEMLSAYGSETVSDEVCSLVFRRPNTQMLLPHPLH